MDPAPRGHMSDAVTINGREVRIISRNKSREAEDDGCIETLIIIGIHHDWTFGTEIDITFPDGIIRGRVNGCWIDLQKKLTHLRVYCS